MFKVTLDHFVSVQKKKKEKKKKEKKKTAGVVPHNKKAKGLDSAFKRQAHHALDGNRSWFGHLA